VEAELGSGRNQHVNHRSNSHFGRYEGVRVLLSYFSTPKFVKDVHVDREMPHYIKISCGIPRKWLWGQLEQVLW
jgi:hypothetical protein